MITAKEKIAANFFNGKYIKINSGDEEDIINIIIEYAKEAIKADRINLLEHVTAIVYGQGDTWAEIDEKSLINAPNIELI